MKQLIEYISSIVQLSVNNEDITNLDNHVQDVVKTMPYILYPYLNIST